MLYQYKSRIILRILATCLYNGITGCETGADRLSTRTNLIVGHKNGVLTTQSRQEPSSATRCQREMLSEYISGVPNEWLFLFSCQEGLTSRYSFKPYTSWSWHCLMPTGTQLRYVVLTSWFVSGSCWSEEMAQMEK